MRKNLYLAIMLVGLGTTAYKAQTSKGVGINTDAPNATLDIRASVTTADNGVSDALLVPRMTLAELVAKDNTTGTYSAGQNGALIYITDDTAGAGTRRAKIVGHGFYYFDNTVPEWKPFVGSATPPVVTLPTYRYVAGGGNVAILATDVGNVVVFNSGNDGNIVLPTPTAAMIGKKLTIIETFGKVQTLTDQNAAIYKTNTLGILQQFGSEFITDGTYWYGLGGQ